MHAENAPVNGENIITADGPEAEIEEFDLDDIEVIESKVFG